jgi:hypothetical protein
MIKKGTIEEEMIDATIEGNTEEMIEEGTIEEEMIEEGMIEEGTIEEGMIEEETIEEGMTKETLIVIEIAQDNV